MIVKTGAPLECLHRWCVLEALICIATLLACNGLSCAQQPPRDIQALLVSDVHFEPFWDPGKVARLAASPVDNWRSIFESAASPDRERRFSDLEKSCRTRGDDTSFPLFESALQAMRARAGEARFIAVSGDLIAHAFDCKYKSFFPNAGPENYRGFVVKTIAFVTGELKQVTTPATPVYVALGNNDSDCGDYKLDEGGVFLSEIGPLMLRGVSKRESAEAVESFKTGGYYTVRLPAPIQKTRLLVLNDVFLSAGHRSCAGKPDPDAANRELAWLAKQLEQSRGAGERVWVMGHIPPGINAFVTLAHIASSCSNKPPVMFLATDRLTQELTDAGEEIRLGIFAHAHSDEFKLLWANRSEAASGTAETPAAMARNSAVAIKMVPSISPINGNNPAFVIAQVDPTTARLADYRVYAAGDSSGAGDWPELYDFDNTYHLSVFSAGSVEQVLSGFSGDPGMKSEASRAYAQNFLTGRPDVLLPLVWPKYVCTLSQDTAAGFTACACSVTPPAATSPGR